MLRSGFKKPFSTVSAIETAKHEQFFTVLLHITNQLQKKSSGSRRPLPKPTPEEEEEEALKQDTTHPVHFKNDGSGKKKKKRRMLGTAIAFGIGGAAGVAAITTGVIHLVNVSHTRDICGGDYCEDIGLKDSFDKVLNLGVATNVLISVAAVGIVTGTILAFVESRPNKNERRGVSVAPSVWGDGGGLLLSGEF